MPEDTNGHRTLTRREFLRLTATLTGSIVLAACGAPATPPAPTQPPATATPTPPQPTQTPLPTATYTPTLTPTATPDPGPKSPDWLKEYEYLGEGGFTQVYVDGVYYLQGKKTKINYFVYGVFPDGDKNITEWQPTITFGLPETPEKIVNVLPPENQPELRARFLSRLYDECLKHPEWFVKVPEGFITSAYVSGGKLTLVGDRPTSLGDFYNFFEAMGVNGIGYVARDRVNGHNGLVWAIPVTRRVGDQQVPEVIFAGVDSEGQDWAWNNRDPSKPHLSIDLQNLTALNELVSKSKDVIVLRQLAFITRLNMQSIDAPHYLFMQKLIADLNKQHPNWKEDLDYGLLHFGTDPAKDKEYKAFIRSNILPTSFYVVFPQ